MRRAKCAIWVAFFFGLTACETLMTRGEVREVEHKRQMQDQVINLQKSTADVNSRFSDIEDELRGLNGRVEVVENKLAVSGQDRERVRVAAEQANTESSKKIHILQEEILRLQEQVGALSAELAAMKSTTPESSTAVRKNLFDVADEFFDKKDWRKAILNYQKFRDSNPKHKKFSEATYKIGVSFQELGMKDEARTFYDEVISKFPNSADAQKAKSRLKNFKK